MNLLTRCQARLDCYIYVIRPGDNLSSIASFFGVSLDRVLALNPSVGDGRVIRTGFQLVIPTPTR